MSSTKADSALASADGRDPAAVTSLPIKPSEFRTLIRAVWQLDWGFYVHGKPGIGKSEMMQAEATREGVAYVDIRLATKTPSQISGVPYPVEEHGQTAARYSIPAELPRDIEIDHIIDIRAAPHLIDFRTHNPRGANKIHYCTSPEITVTALDPELTAKIIGQELDRFYVVLEDEDGNRYSGSVRYQITGKVRALICLDELSSANPAVQVSAYSLVLERRSGEYVAPDGVKIVAAGNRQMDRAVHHRMSKALGNRFTHYELKEDYPEWAIWAKEHKLYPTLLKFHESTGGRFLCVFDPQSDDLAWASPRTHAALSKLEYVFDSLGIFDHRIRLAKMVGTVGETVGAQYALFKKNSDLPFPDDILSGKVVERKKKFGIPEQRHISQNVANVMRARLGQIKEKNFEGDDARLKHLMDLWYEEGDRAIKFFTERFAPEMVASTVKMMVKEHKLPLDPGRMPNFQQVLKTNKNALAG